MNPQDVAALVDMLTDAPFDPTYHGDYAAHAERYVLAFRLQDGTTFTRAYWSETGEVWHGITVPEPFRDLVVQALQKNR